MINDYIRDLYFYYRRLIIFNDILDPKEDELTVEQLAVSAIAAELDIPKTSVEKALGLDR